MDNVTALSSWTNFIFSFLLHIKYIRLQFVSDFQLNCVLNYNGDYVSAFLKLLKTDNFIK